MKKRKLLLSIFIIGFSTAIAQHRVNKHHPTEIIQETAVVEGIGVVPVYKVLVTESGKAMSARDWASMKTIKMQELLNLDNKQAEKLYKVNLGWAKDTRTRPISDGFRKNNVNYWAFREIRSIIPHL